MNKEDTLEVNEQNKLVEEEQAVVFAPDYSAQVKPVAPINESFVEENIEPVESVVEENVEPVVEVNEETKLETFVDQVNEEQPSFIPNYSTEVKPVEVKVTEEEKTEEEKAILREKISQDEVLENPSAKIVLNREEAKNEVRQEINDNVTKNESLKFVVILGILLLVVIFAIPYLSNFFQL